MERYDRQIRVFGQYGQDILRGLTVAIVGVGGIGSLVSILLIRLGVGRIILIDPDVVEESNLNRLAGATLEDAQKGRPKVHVHARYGVRIDPDIEIIPVQDSILKAGAQQYLKMADMIFGCTDNQATRWILNKFAVQHSRPYFDTGTGIKAGQNHAVEHAGGQVRVVIPGMGCLNCIDGIKVDIAQQEMLPEAERQIHRQLGYIDGADMKAPAVASLNGVIANLAVTEFMAFATGFRPVRRFLGYDFVHATVLPYTFPRNPDCFTCSPTQSFATGDLGGPLPIHLLINEPELHNTGETQMQTETRNIHEAIAELLSQAQQRNLAIEGDAQSGWFLIKGIRIGWPFNRSRSPVMVKFFGDSKDPVVFLPDRIEIYDFADVCPHLLAKTASFKGWKTLCPHMFQDVGDELLQFITCLCGLLANPDLCGCMGCPARDAHSTAAGKAPEALPAVEGGRNGSD